jgi:hypothetical protein
MRLLIVEDKNPWPTSSKRGWKKKGMPSKWLMTAKKVERLRNEAT